MDEVWKAVLGETPDELLRPLEQVITTGRRAPDEAQQALDTLMTDAQALRGLVAAWSLDPERTALLLEQLGVQRGLRGRAEKLRRLLTRLARQRKAEEARDRAARLTQAGLAEELGCEELPEGLRAPPGWEVREDGVFRVSEDLETGAVRLDRVALFPMVVTARLVDLHTGSTQLRLSWPTSGGWVARDLPREEALDPRGLARLAAFQAPVSYVTARPLVQFLLEFEHHNRDSLPLRHASAAMGWMPGQPERFLWGERCLEAGSPARPAPAVSLVVDPGGRQFAGAWHARGTWEGWLEVAALARPHPGLWPGLYAALVPPLMRLLPQLHNFILDLAGTTSLGKTTALRFAASAWGLPDERSGGVVGSWGSTRVWIERASGLLGDLPLFLDDTRRARRPEDVARVVYEVCSGGGRGRGAPQGTRPRQGWRTVLLSTGEEPITSFSEEAGTRARTVALWGSPFGGSSADLAKRAQAIEALADLHFGHLGPRLVQLLLDQPALLPRISATWERLVLLRQAQATQSGVGARSAVYRAGLDLAAWLAHEHLGVPRPLVDPDTLLRAALEDGAREADRPAAALASAWSWAVSQQHRFWPNPGSGHGGPEQPPPGGWLGTWERDEGWSWVGFLKDPLKRHLKERGFSAAAILKQWAERGWLVDRQSRKDLSVYVGSRRDYVIAVKAQALAEVTEGNLGE